MINFYNSSSSLQQAATQRPDDVRLTMRGRERKRLVRMINYFTLITLLIFAPTILKAQNQNMDHLILTHPQSQVVCEDANNAQLSVMMSNPNGEYFFTYSWEVQRSNGWEEAITGSSGFNTLNPLESGNYRCTITVSTTADVEDIVGVATTFIARVTIHEVPGIPSPPSQTVSYCMDALNPFYTVSVSSDINTATVMWYSDPSGTNPIGAGNSVIIVQNGSSSEKTPESPGNPATYEPFIYYAQAIGSNGCISALLPVSLIIFPTLKLEIELSDLEGCSPFNLSAINKSPSEFAAYQWAWASGVMDAPRNITSNYLFQTSGTVPETAKLRLIGTSTVNVSSIGNYCSNEISETFVIHPAVRADFNINETEGCDPLSVMFSGSASQGAYNFRWYWDTPNPPQFEPGNPVLPVNNFADNDPVNNKYYGISSPNPINVFTNDRNSSAPREYHVWLQVDNGMCHDNKDTVIVVYPSPHAGFSNNLTNNTICAPLPVIFTNESEGAAYPNNTNRTLYEWYFGDGTMATLSFGTGTESHIFTSLNESTPKNYTIWMTAFNTYPSEVVPGKGITCRTTTSQNINVIPEVKADFSLPVEGCSPLPVRFQNQSIGAVSYFDWNFGDGTNSIEQNPTHTYPHIVGNQIGNYTITLTAGNTFGCKDVISKTFRLNPQPVASFEVDNAQGCHPMTVTFYNTSNTSAGAPNPTTGMTYIFDFNDGEPSVYKQDDSDVLHVITNTLGRNLSVFPTLTAINEWGCTNISNPRQITVFPYVRAHFEMEDSVGCSPLKVRFRNGSQGYDEFVYNFGDKEQYNGDRYSNQLHTHTFVNPSMYRDTVYFVTLSVAGSGCTANTTRKVVVLASPIADFYPPAPYPSAYPYPPPLLQMENRIRLPDRRYLDYQWAWADHVGYMRYFSRSEIPGPPPIDTWGAFDIMQHVTAPNGKCSDSIIRTISVLQPLSGEELTLLSSDDNLGNAMSLSDGKLATSTPYNTTAKINTTATLFAIPKAGNIFVGWNDGNTNNPRTITVSENVTYTAKFEICEKCDDCPPSVTTSSFEMQASGSMTVFPNPTENMINVLFENLVNNGILTLYDINGRAVLSQTLSGYTAQIDLSHLAAGGYILRLVENGKLSAGIKIVKQ